ncbi:MAG: 30S ribosomal protein S16, partial [Planctomycetota bacterium]
MFDSLATALGKAYRSIVGQKVLTEANVDEGIRAVRTALLEADVNFQVAKDFVADVRQRVLGQKVIESVEPGQQFVKCFHDALTELLGGQQVGLPIAPQSPLLEAAGAAKKALATRAVICFAARPFRGSLYARRQFPLAVTLRQKRFGRLNHPTYRVVATDPRFPRDGRIIEALGYYLPLMPRAQEQVKLNAERIQHWLSHGARPSDTVGQLIEKSGMTVPVPKKPERQKSKGKPA